MKARDAAVGMKVYFKSEDEPYPVRVIKTDHPYTYCVLESRKIRPGKLILLSDKIEIYLVVT